VRHIATKGRGAQILRRQRDDIHGQSHSGTPEIKGIAPLPFQKGATRAEVPFHYSIKGNFMVCQDRLETNQLQPSAHQENSE